MSAYFVAPSGFGRRAYSIYFFWDLGRITFVGVASRDLLCGDVAYEVGFEGYTCSLAIFGDAFAILMGLDFSPSALTFNNGRGPRERLTGVGLLEYCIWLTLIDVLGVMYSNFCGSLIVYLLPLSCFCSCSCLVEPVLLC